MNADDWVELTDVFDPLEHMEILVKLLGPKRVFACDDDNVYLFTDKDVTIRHTCVQSKGRWICSCSQPSPCVASVIMMVASFSWIIRPPEEDAAAPQPQVPKPED